MTIRIWNRAQAITGLLLCIGASFAQAQTGTDSLNPGILSGPMPGHSAMREVTLWMQGTGSDEVVIEYWPEGQTDQVRTSSPRRLAAGDQYTAHFRIGDLEPGTTYAYRVIMNGDPVSVPEKLEFHTQPLWQWRTDPPAFRLVAGSCAYINDPPYDRPKDPYGARYDIFQRIADRNPDVMLWLGDNVYFREADYDSRWGMAERYRHSRALPELQPLLRGTHHYAIWDDHEYGPNDANRSFSLKGESLALFERYWANPAYGLPDTKGIFGTFSFHDIDFFLLDNRFYRDDDHGPDSPGKTMLGHDQLAWLKNALLDSRAPFKIIASGSQMFNDLAKKEGWNHFPEERSAFLEWLDEAAITGVMFMSGDVHYSALRKVDRPGTYPIYELTCSPLTSGPRKRGFASEDTLLIPDTFVGERNFCQLDFSGPRAKRNLRMTVFNADGKVKWTREIAASELQ